MSWEEALNEVASRLGDIAREDPSAILTAHYSGTMSLIGFHFPMRFFHRLGATEVDPDSICNNAGHAALKYTYGSSLIGFDPRTAADSACIMVWGANPSVSAPHRHEYWLAESPAKVIVVDPLRTATAAQADLYLQPFPGTDAALAFGLLHVLRRDHLTDREFIRRHVLGWEEIEALVERCTPTWAEEVTGIASRDVERAAQIYGSGPSLLWLGQGLQRQRRGGNVIRACAILPAVTGNFARPGSGVLYLNGNERRGIDEAYLTGAKLGGHFAERISHMGLASRLEDSVRSRALVCWNINIAASNPEQRRLHLALHREDLFTVVVDLFRTDTVDFADVVLPAASFLEFDDLVASYFDLTLSAQVKVMEPLGQALPNQEIFRRLAHRMGLEEAELYESDASIIERVLAGVGTKEGFEGLAAVGTVQVSERPVLQFANLDFPTPSGKIEIASASAEADGFPRVPAPSFDSRPNLPALRLLTPAGSWFLNDTFGNDVRVRTRSGRARVVFNPEDAMDLGLREGDLAIVGNRTGELRLRVSVSEAVPRGVACAEKGRWPKGEDGGANVNVLNSGEPADMGCSTAVHSTEVMVERAGGTLEQGNMVGIV